MRRRLMPPAVAACPPRRLRMHPCPPRPRALDVSSGRQRHPVFRGGPDGADAVTLVSDFLLACGRSSG